MAFIAVAVRTALAAVFVVSGIAKLSDRTGTRQAVAGFGVPAGPAAWVAVLLAPVELGVALLVLLTPTATLGLVLVLVLLTAFTVAVLRALRAGRRPECHCFGRIGGADISARTVLRNGVLAALAAVGLVGLAARGDSTSDGSAVAAALAGLALAAGLLLAEGLAGRAARRQREREDLAAYESAAPVLAVPAPRFTLGTPAGIAMSLDDLLAPGLPVLLVTLSPGCGSCVRLRPDVAQWAELLRPRVTVAVLAIGTTEANEKAYETVPHLPVLLDGEDVRRQLGTTATPSAVVIGADGVVASPVASGEALVRRLLASTITGAEVGAPVASGDPEDAEATTPAAELGLSSVIHPRSTVEVHAIDGASVLLDTVTGGTVVVDQIGALVWSVLDGTSRLDEIVADIAEVFTAPVEVVGPDVLALVQSLGRAGLLVGVAPEAAPPHPDARSEAAAPL